MYHMEKQKCLNLKVDTIDTIDTIDTKQGRAVFVFGFIGWEVEEEEKN